MKNYILKSTLFALFVSVCTSCSNNDDEEPFEPITINLIGLGIEQDDTSFTQQGFSFTAVNVESSEGFTLDGILLAFPDNQGNPSSLSLDLSSVTGISTITASITDQGGGEIELLNNGQVIETIDVNRNQPQFSDFTFIINGREIDAFRYNSFEGFIRSIRLE